MAATSHAASAHSSAAHLPAAVPVSFVVGEEDGINQSIGTFRRFDGVAQSFFAAAIHAVGKNNERLAALLLFHQLIGRQEHGVVQQSTASAVAARAAASAPTSAAGAIRIASRGAACARLRKLRPAQLVERSFQLLPRGSQVLQQLYLAIEVNHERLVLISAQHTIEKSVAGVAFL